MQCPQPRLLLVAACTFGLVLILYLVYQPIPLPRFRITGTSAGKLSDNLFEQVANQTLGFQNLFAINLPYRYDHRDSLSLAAAFSGLQIEYVDGVTNVSRDYLPPGGKEKNLKDGVLGAWRAHMNVLRMIVERNITSALVFEDDADWDIRIKSQMQQFAEASRLLLQPLSGTSNDFLDRANIAGQKPQDFDVTKYSVTTPLTSPYADVDRWDILWLGHCGCRFPRADDKIPQLGRAVIFNDQTVPEPQHIVENEELVKQYPPHTRVVSRARRNACTLAYGITQRGARRFLYELGVRKMDRSTDNAFATICDGENDRSPAVCLTVRPQLFNHHRPVGSKASFSDIQDHGSEWNDIAYTRNVRWSTRVNFPKLVEGNTDYMDFFKDGEEGNKFGPG